MRYRSKRRVKILSIDGGGIRGLIPALVLEELEKRFQDCLKGRPFSSIFDLIAGTSTGAIIALGLILPKRCPHRPNTYETAPAMSAADIASFYMQLGAEVFPQNLFNGLRTVVQVFREKYDEERLERVLEDKLGSATLADCLTDVLVTAYDTERGRPHLFRSGALKEKIVERRWRIFGQPPAEEPELNFRLKDVARAASAAPTYFSPACISPVPDNGEKYCLIDGGVFASNPAFCALVEAGRLYPRAEEFLIVSLGTGRVERHYGCSDLKDWGYLEWMNPARKAPLPSIMLKAQNEVVDQQMRRLRHVRYHRFNASLGDASEDMDDASAQNLERLRGIARSIVRKHDAELDTLCREMKR